MKGVRPRASVCRQALPACARQRHSRTRSTAFLASPLARTSPAATHRPSLKRVILTSWFINEVPSSPLVTPYQTPSNQAGLADGWVVPCGEGREGRDC